MKKLSLVLCLLLVLVSIFAFNVAASDTNVAKDGTASTTISKSWIIVGQAGWYPSKVPNINDGNYETGVCGANNEGGYLSYYVTLETACKVSYVKLYVNGQANTGWVNNHDVGSANVANHNTEIKVMMYDATDALLYDSGDMVSALDQTEMIFKPAMPVENVAKVEIYYNNDNNTNSILLREVEIYKHVCEFTTWTETKSALACLTDGVDVYSCDCTATREVITKAKGTHTWNEGVENDAGTAIIQTCTVEGCGATQEVGLDHTHSYDTFYMISVDPTCVEDGVAIYRCDCGEVTNIPVDPTGVHNYTEFVGYVEGKAPTYLKDGVSIYQCATCTATEEHFAERLKYNLMKYASISVKEGTEAWTLYPAALIDGNITTGSPSGNAGGPSTHTFILTLNEDCYYNEIIIVTNSTGSYDGGPAGTGNGAFVWDKKSTNNYTFTVVLRDVDGNAVYESGTLRSINDAVAYVDENGVKYDAVTITLEESVTAYTMEVSINRGANTDGFWEFIAYGLPVSYHEEHVYTVLQSTTTPATCTTEGWGTYRCAKCEATTEAAIPMLKHNYNQFVSYVDDVAPTCTAGTSATYKCADCEATEVRDVAATGHTEVVDNAVAATCTETGLTEGKHCSVCGDVLVAQETVDALGHTPSEDGVTCTVCNTTLAVAKVGDTLYATLEEAFANAEAEAEIVLVANVELAGKGIVVDKKVTLNLNGFNILVPNDTVGDGVFCVTANGELVINGTGIVDGYSPLNGWCMAIWAKGGKVIINGGTYTNVGATSDPDGEHFDLIYVSEGGYVEITGGTFICETPEWTLNSKNSAPGTINVYGGTFTGFNPFANKDGENFLAGNYCATAEADGTYTVAAYENETHTHTISYGETWVYVSNTCVSKGYQSDICSECGKEFFVSSDIDEENGHEYAEERNEADTGYVYTCTLCGYSYETITKGTAAEPLTAVIDDNPVVVIDGLEFVIYQIPVSYDLGKLVITVSEGAYVQLTSSPMNVYYPDSFETGKTSYEATIDSTTIQGWGPKYYCIAVANCETFNVAYTELERPQLVVGENAVQIPEVLNYMGMPSAGTAIYVVKVPGSYILSAAEGETNAVVTVGYDTINLAEGTCEFTVAEGETVMIAINAYNYEVDEINLVLTCVHAWVDADCDTPKTCSTCGATEGEALGHDYEATENEDGSVTYTCQNGCGETYTVNNSLINGTYFYESIDVLKLVFADGTLTITDNSGVLNIGGTYTYTYNVTTWTITTNNPDVFLNVYRGGAIVVLNSMYQLSEYIPPVELELDDNTITITSNSGAEYVTFIAPEDGDYVITGSDNFIALMLNGTFLDPYFKTPYTVTLKKGEGFEFYVGSTSLDTNVVTVTVANAHECEFVESSRVKSTCTTAGSVTYTCSCEASYTEVLPLAPHTEEKIPAVPSTSKTTGMTSGIKCSVCGEEIVAPTTAVTGFKLNASLSLGEDISMYFNVLIPSSLKVEGSYVVAQFTEIDDTLQVITEYKYDSSTGRYKYKFTSTKPQFMTDTMNIIAYACDENGIESAYEVPSYTIVQYLTGLVKNADSEAKLILLSDILALGDATQIFMGWKDSEEQLPSNIVKAAGYTLKPSTFVAPTESIAKVDRDGYDCTNVDWRTFGLKLGSTMKPTLYFNGADLDGVTAKVWVNGVEMETVYGDLGSLPTDSKGRYILTIEEGIKVLDYDSEIVAKFFDAEGNQIGSVITISVNSYITLNYAKATAAQQAFMRAIYVYGQSVANNF